MTTINFCQYSCTEMFGQKYMDVRLFLDIIVWCCHLLSMYCATLCPCIYVFVQLYVHVLCNFMSMYCATLCAYIVEPYVHVLCNLLSTPKGSKVYPASRRRSNKHDKRVGLKGQLGPHCVPWLKNYILAYKRLSTSLGSETLNTSSLGLGGTTI